MPKLFRICRSVYAPEDPSGAALYPGRWNALNQRVLYCASSMPLAVLEMRANGVEFQALRSGYHFASAEADDAAIEKVPESFYTPDWALDRVATQDFGSRWFGSRQTLLLAARSSVLATDFNYVANALHPEFGGLRFSDPRPIPLDARL